MNKFGTHSAALIIIIFVMTYNLQASAGSPTNLINNGSILNSFLGPIISDEEIIEEGLVDAELATFRKKYITTHAVGHNPIPVIEAETEQENIVETSGTMAGGNTLRKPIISDDNISLASQELIETIVIHTVKDGESIGSLARRYGISVNTILWENKLRSRDFIHPGQKLTILPTSGIRHVVKRGESVKRIARKYNSTAEKILSFNEITNPALIRPGQKIIIPEGSPLYSPTPTRKKTKITQKIFNKSKNIPNKKSGLIWPTKGKVITQYWHWRHSGLDIDGITGDPIYAVDSGKIVISGWNNGGYGLQVVMDHGNGMKTRYAHCSKLLHKVGTTLNRGDTVCLMGSTGRSTGSHLHFEIIVNGVRRNPIQYVNK